MRKADVMALVDFGYWATHRILNAAEHVPADVARAPATVTTRNLWDTLIHDLDVEWSWRLRLRGEPPEAWGPEAELRPDDFPTVESLRERWSRDEMETRTWLKTLSDDALAGKIDLGGKDRFPLWYFLMHMVMHSAQQRADAATLLSAAGHSPGDLDFLDYADSRHARDEA